MTDPRVLQALNISSIQSKNGFPEEPMDIEDPHLQSEVLEDEYPSPSLGLQSVLTERDNANSFADNSDLEVAGDENS